MKHLKQKVSLGLLFTLLLTFPITTLAEEPTETSPALTTTISAPAPQPIVLSFKKKWEEHREGEKLRAPIVLGKKLDAYTLTIQNNGVNPVQIVSGQLTNHIPPEEAYVKLKQSAGMQYAGSAALGLAAAPFTFGFTLLTGLFLNGPIVAAAASAHNQSALAYVNQNPGIITSDILQPGESRHYELLTLKENKPTVQLIVQDLNTQTEWTITQ